jgi:hypothetical protein
VLLEAAALPGGEAPVDFGFLFNCHRCSFFRTAG